MGRKRHRDSKTKDVPITRAIWTEDRSCPLCGREMIEGGSLNDHHLIPKSFGGVEKHVMHKVCHTKLHSVFSETELAHVYNTFEKLKTHPDIRNFIKWVRKQEPETISKHRRPRMRR